jgi:hypothetical protein
LDPGDLPFLAQAGKAAGERVNDLVLLGSQAIEVDARRRKLQAPACGLVSFGDEPGSVEQGFAGNAADVQAHASWLGAVVNESNAKATVGSQKCRRVPTGTSAKNDKVGVKGFRHLLLQIRNPESQILNKFKNLNSNYKMLLRTTLMLCATVHKNHFEFAYLNFEFV